MILKRVRVTDPVKKMGYLSFAENRLIFIKGIPFLFVFFAWGIFWMIPIMLIFAFLDLLFYRDISASVGTFGRLFLELLTLFFFGI